MSPSSPGALSWALRMPLTASATQAGLSHACFCTNSIGPWPLPSNAVFFLGVGPQGFLLERYRQGAQLNFTQWGISRMGTRLGKCLAEELLNLKSSSYLEKPGCCLHRLLSSSHPPTFPPEQEGKEV